MGITKILYDLAINLTGLFLIEFAKFIVLSNKNDRYGRSDH